MRNNQIYLQNTKIRVKVVFHGSAYQLSKCAIYSFYTFYGVITASALMGFIGLIVKEWALMFEIGFAIGSLSTWMLAMYLPSLFVYKLHQINKKVKITTNASKSKRSDGSESNEGGILAVMRKCTILTMFSLITTWCCLIGGILEIIFGSKFNILVFWHYSIILDVCSNFIGLMLSNSFCDDYYRKICGCIERCLFDGNCCKNEVNANAFRVGSVSPSSGPAMELSAYMESTQTTKQTQSNEERMDDLDLDITYTQNEEVP